MAYPTRSITGLPPNLFSGGAVGFNPTPIVDYVNNVKARDQAKQDAFTKYYANLGNNLTPSGMHADDIPDVIKGKNDWQQFSLEHRRELMNPSLDDGQAYAQANKMYNDTLGIARKSQAKVQNLLSIKSIVSDPKKLSLISDDSQNAIHRAGLRVSDPDYQPLNPNDLHFNPKPFDLSDQAKVANILKAFKPEQVPGTPVQDKNTGMQTTPFTAKYSTDQTKGMYQIASDLYAAHPGFKAEVDKHANLNDPDYDRFNKIFQQHFKPEDGFNQNITTPEDMAAAKVITLNPNGNINPKVQPIPAESAIGQQNKKNQTKFNSDVSLNRQEALRDYNISHPLPTAGSQAAQSGHDIVEDAYQMAKNNAKANPDRYTNTVTHPDGTKEVNYVLPIDQEVRNKLARLDPVTNKKIVPVEIRVSPDGQKYTPIFYSGAETKDGKRAINTTFSVPMPRSNFEAVVGDVHKSKAQTQPTQKVDINKLRNRYNY